MTTEKIAEALDISNVELSLDVDQTVVPPSSVDIDFENARSNYYEILDASKAAINSAIRIAAEKEDARSIEVLSGLLKNVADINKQLIQLSKDKEDAKQAKKGSGPVNSQPQIGNVQQAVFVGSSADLNKLLNK